MRFYLNWSKNIEKFCLKCIPIPFFFFSLSLQFNNEKFLTHSRSPFYPQNIELYTDISK